jgi:cob(I)alamin adenosyltransferase
MKIYTKTGDKGETSLLGGRRVSKNDIRIEAYGTVDELNANLGLIHDYGISRDQKEKIHTIQNELFDMGAYLACEVDPEKFKLSLIGEDQILRLEEEIDEMEKDLSPLRNFILPAGHLAVSQCHVARCVCRRAERNIIHLSQQEKISDTVISYLNRLSDYLFVLSRKIAHDMGVEEIKWTSSR